MLLVMLCLKTSQIVKEKQGDLACLQTWRFIRLCFIFFLTVHTTEEYIVMTSMFFILF